MFQKKVIEKYLSKLDSDLLLKKYIQYCSIFANKQKQENIRNSKEEQYQEGFIRDLFCSVLDYTIKPEANYNILTELKNESKSNSKKSDAAIIINNEVKAVIELKGTDTQDLDKVAFQAFSYKNHHEKCNYVIVSNFERLRLYVETQIEFTEFNLFKLTKEDFDLLYLLLSLDNISSDVPLKLKHETLTEEIEITNSFYADYSTFKRVLFEDLIENNPDIDKLLLFKKTQKLLDRLLFVMFCEDRNLLPTNSTLGIINDYKKLKEMGYYQPLYNYFFKVFFEKIDKGFTHEVDHSKDIFAYNGGLFKPDETLDNIKVGDKVLLEHCLKLANYDFASQISVDTLGRIFENSLTEIEEVQNEIENEKNGIKQKSSNIGKRKKDGVFYTPEYITKYIVENTIGKLCEEKRNELSINDEVFAPKKHKKPELAKLDAKLQIYRDWLLNLKILDPACGSGAFLIAALHELVSQHSLIDRYYSNIHAGEFNFTQIENSILENNLYGVDVNEESVEIAKLSLWLNTAKKNRKLTSLNDKIKCGNSLIDDESVAGEKAFDWAKEFPEVFASSTRRSPTNVGADLHCSDNSQLSTLNSQINDGVIGVGCDGCDCRQLCSSQNRHCETNSDTSLQGVENAVAIQKMPPFVKSQEPPTTNHTPPITNNNSGFDVIIGNPPYVTRGMAENVKKFINSNYETAEYQLDLYVCFMEKAVKLLRKSGLIGFIVPNSWLKNMMMSKCRQFLLNKFCLTDIIRTTNVFVDASVDTLVYIGKNEIENQNDSINILDFKDGNAVFSHFASKERFKKNNNFMFDIEVNDKMSVILEKVKRDSLKVKDLFDVCRGINPYDKYTGQSEEVIKTKAYHADYKKDETFVPLLQGRHIGRYFDNWDGKTFISYGDWLAAPREAKYFTGKRIVFREVLGKTLVSTILTEDIKIDRSLYIALPLNDDVNIYCVDGILNSVLMSTFFRYSNNEFDDLFPKMRVAEFRELTIKFAVIVTQNKLSDYEKNILKYYADLQKKITRFSCRIKETYGFEKTTQNLENFYKLSFADFVKELSKVKVKLSMKQKDELEDYFNDYVKEITALNETIATTDEQINSLVYKLYNLTDEEIKIIKRE